MITISDFGAASELVKLAMVATAVITEHQDDHGRCVICESAWPCERVATAEHNIELL